MKRVHIYIFGRVQGVFFRASCKETADRLGIAGWVRNLPDGRVEAVFEGTEKEIEKVIEWCYSGSPGKVETVEKTEEKAEGLERFEIR
ncbi:MAG TPA: acylphosphatase [Patescibacteria group bacterium]|nr:acylphosphatase [Patescibacteria group bacterium]